MVMMLVSMILKKATKLLNNIKQNHQLNILVGGSFCYFWVSPYFRTGALKMNVGQK